MTDQQPRTDVGGLVERLREAGRGDGTAERRFNLYNEAASALEATRLSSEGGEPVDIRCFDDYKLPRPCPRCGNGVCQNNGEVRRPPQPPCSGIWRAAMGERRIFVFGSNLAGRHGAGSAKHAAKVHGAQYGVGEGLTGNAYAIPTKDRQLRILPLSDIAHSVATFKVFARSHQDWQFDLVAIGCGLAGYEPGQIAPLFRDAPPNVNKPREFQSTNPGRLGNG